MEFITEKSRIYATDAQGRTIAEVTFPSTGDGTVCIDHTWVDSSLRGQGIAGKLLETLADHLRSAGLRAQPVCSYAVAWFAARPELSQLTVSGD